MARPLDAERLRQALEALGADLAARGVFVELAVYGGGALILQFAWRRSTWDVDAVVREGFDEAAIAPSVAWVARQMDLDAGGLNNAVGMFTPLDEPEALFGLSGTYPCEGPPGLRTLVARPHDLLAMKLQALSSLDRGTRDMDDARAPAAHLSIGDVEGLSALYASIYGEAPPVEARVPLRVRRGEPGMRPAALREVAVRIREDGDWDHHTREFLDRFYLADGDIERQAAMIAEDPGFVGSPRPDAYLGGVGEHLARRWGLPIPGWVRDDARYLTTAWFLPDEAPLRSYLLCASPVSFRVRLIFTGPDPLQRARFPYHRGVRSLPLDYPPSGLIPATPDVDTSGAVRRIGGGALSRLPTAAGQEGPAGPVVGITPNPRSAAAPAHGSPPGSSPGSRGGSAR